MKGLSAELLVEMSSVVMGGRLSSCGKVFSCESGGLSRSGKNLCNQGIT